MLFQKVSIIGFGLIGSSLARAIRKHGMAEEIVCVDRSVDVCKKAVKLKLCDKADTDLRKGVDGADLVVLAVPVGACGTVAEQIRYSLKEGAIVTDVGSVKGAVVNAVQPHIPDKAHFIPAHPIAGTEHSGPEAGFAELFEGRWCIITPLPDSDIQKVEKVTQLWEGCGSVIEIMDVKRHDLVLGITSHLPHLIAYTIVGTATDLEEDTQDDVIKFSASGFRDFTRIAASDPVMWRDVFLNNREAVLEILQRFTEDLTAMQRAIRKEDGDYLQAMFTRTRDIRRKVIEAGQAGDASPTQASEAAQPSGDRQKASGSAG
ncbi:MAG: prephenate/arogenate dehydrogenase family protein [Rhodospirillales bacterium]|nr:prephenate/arogenate dehydrogenase family protein [Rhodospirillales bacterium]MCB9995884.1 prephenate/arogenate dehydrogenase family protein [Rhodospirillales bacterium]